MKFIYLSFVLLAAAPQGTDPDSSTSHWYQSLQSPATGYSCCSIADCRPVQYRIGVGRYEVFIDRKSFGDQAPNDWVAVPKDVVVRRGDNPVGEAVACWHGTVRCFVEAAQG